MTGYVRISVHGIGSIDPTVRGDCLRHPLGFGPMRRKSWTARIDRALRAGRPVRATWRPIVDPEAPTMGPWA